VPKISVIVPVFNAEKTLNRCIDSLLAQTFHEFEVLLINDGSTDRSYQICEEYAKNDKRIRIFHQKNQGVALARQKGLDNAQGEYIIHADPDDWIEKDELESLYCTAVQQNADMVICDFFVNYPHKQIVSRQRPSSLNHKIILEELFTRLHGSCVNKLVKRELFNKYNIKFPAGVQYLEDKFVNTCLLIYDIKVTYLERAFYHYIQYKSPTLTKRKITKETYERDVELYHKFMDIFDGAPHPKSIDVEFSNIIYKSAFLSGSFSSQQFAKEMQPYSKYLLIISNKDLWNKLKRVSLNGHYKTAYYTWKLNNRLKTMTSAVYAFLIDLINRE